MKADEEKLIEELKSEGYKEVYVWQDKPNEFYEEHSHPYETKLIILEGEISIKSGEKFLVLKPGDFFVIRKNEIHKAKTGLNGCRYLVGEDRGMTEKELAQKKEEIVKRVRNLSHPVIDELFFRTGWEEHIEKSGNKALPDWRIDKIKDDYEFAKGLLDIFINESNIEELEKILEILEKRENEKI